MRDGDEAVGDPSEKAVCGSAVVLERVLVVDAGEKILEVGLACGVAVFEDGGRCVRPGQRGGVNLDYFRAHGLLRGTPGPSSWLWRTAPMLSFWM